MSVGNTKYIGYTGETLVCGYLGNKNYEIIARNYRTKFGEIDIIVISPDKTLVFCEVKTLKINRDYKKEVGNSYTQKSGNNVEKLGKVWQGLATNKNMFIPEDHMNKSKIYKFRRISKWYANNNMDNLGCKSYRLDLITVDLYNNSANIRHYKNI